ncbi:MAG: hypothetical protein V7L29_03045 [Nostoc sp.]
MQAIQRKTPLIINEIIDKACKIEPFCVSETKTKDTITAISNGCFFWLQKIFSDVITLSAASLLF